MKTKLLMIVVAGFFSLTMSNCMVAQFGLPTNVLIYHTGTAGFSTGYNPVQTDAKGESCATALSIPLLGWPLMAWGDASVEAAAGQSKIRKVSGVSHHAKPGHFWQEWCTVVRGQQ